MVASGTEFNQREFDYAYPQGIERHFWTVARSRVIADAIKSLPDRGERILEIGCGRGIVVTQLRNRGFNCFGVELAAIPVPPSAAQFVTAGVHAWQLPPEFRHEIQTILLLDVIEHLPDPAAFIAGTIKYYPNIRNLVVTVPARRELWSNYDEFYRHYRRYDLEMLRQNLTDAKLTIIRVGYFFHSFYPLLLLAKLGKGRSTKIKPPSPRTVGLHTALAYLLYWDFVLLPSRLCGTSAIAIATRNTAEKSEFQKTP
jgi:hypothetical protein